MKKSLASLFIKTAIVLTALFLYGPKSSAQTTVSGNLQGAWTKAQSPYRLIAPCVIPAGQVLTIEPGVEIQFGFSSYLNILGTLTAEGTVTDSIRIIPYNSTYGQYGGSPIVVGTSSTNSSFKYTKINGFINTSPIDTAAAILTIRSSSCIVQNCSFTNIQGSGIHLAKSGPQVINNVFSTTILDVVTSTDNLDGLASNGALKIGIVYAMTSDATLTKGNFYKLLDYLTVPQNKTLTVNPGVQVFFTFNKSQLTVSGTLKAEGTIADSIKFTSDAVIQTTGNINQTGPIVLAPGSLNNSLKYVMVNGLGYFYSNDKNAAIVVQSPSTIIQNCSLQNILGSGIYLDAVNVPILNNNFSTRNLDVVSNADALPGIAGNGALKIGLLGMVNDASLIRTHLYYRLLYALTVPENKTLTVESGVTLQFPNYSQLLVSGTLKAEGTVADSIKFSYIEGFGGTYSESPKAFITVDAASQNSSLKYIRINGLGYFANSGYNPVMVINSPTCTIQNSSLENIKAGGIKIDIINPQLNNFRPQIIDCLFSTASLDVFLSADNLFKLSGNGRLKLGLISSMTIDGRLTNTYYYTALNTLFIPPGKTLTIDPGVAIDFTSSPSSPSIVVRGTLKAEGTPFDSIRITGAPITFYSNVWPIIFDTASGNSSLKYVKFSGFGFTTTVDYQGTLLYSSSFNMENCSFENIQGSGVEVGTAKAFPVFRNNRFNTSKLDALVDLDHVKTVLGNGPLKIGLSGTDMATDDTLPSGHLYRFIDKVTVRPNRTLTIQPGITLEVPDDSFAYNSAILTVQGTLIAKGTADNYIKFVRTNGRYQNFQSGPIILEASSRNSVLKYVLMDSLGYSIRAITAAVLIVRSNSCSIDNVVIQNSKAQALSLENAGSMVITRSCFINNLTGAVSSTAGSPTFVNCNFVNNRSFGINNTSANSTDIIDARNCWWGSTSGPNHYITNPTATGDIVADKVVYAPWSTSSLDCAVNQSSLPLNLTDFKVSVVLNEVQCLWETSSESNTSHFIIQRSKDGINYDDIGRVSAAIRSTSILNYSFVDGSSGSGVTYYRLQMFDKDGSYTYSKVLSINIDEHSSGVIFPNPVHERLNLQLQNRRTEKVVIQILDLQGKVLKQEGRQVQAGSNHLSFNVSGLSVGMYVLYVKGEKIDRLTFVKE